MTNSFFDALSALYSSIDALIYDHYTNNPQLAKLQPCKKGCDACCSQFFEISEGEALYILNYLSEQPEPFVSDLSQKITVAFNTFTRHYHEFYSTYFENSDAQPFDADAYFDDETRFHIRIPCPCLDKQGSCTIYEARPLVCRTTGSSYTSTDDQGEICEIIPSSVKAMKWQADLVHLQEAIWSISEIHDPNDRDHLFELRQFPIFYYLYDLLCRGETIRDAFNNPLLIEYKNLSREDLEERLFKQLILE